MTETRDFPTAVVASLSTGIVLCEEGFSPIHEAASFLMGHPIWTHHFASKQLWEAMQKTILAQWPEAPTEKADIGRDNWREYAAELEAKFGPTIKIRKGSGLTAMLPTDGIPDHLKDKTIIINVSPLTSAK